MNLEEVITMSLITNRIPHRRTDGGQGGSSIPQKLFSKQYFLFKHANT